MKNNYCRIKLTQEHKMVSNSKNVLIKTFYAIVFFFWRISSLFLAVSHSMEDLISHTRDWTRGPCIGTVVSYPLDQWKSTGE